MLSGLKQTRHRKRCQHINSKCAHMYSTHTNMVCTCMGTHSQTNIHPGDSVKLWRRDNVTALPLQEGLTCILDFFFYFLFLLLIISFLVTWPKGKVRWREAMQCVSMALMCPLWFRVLWPNCVLGPCLFHWVLAEVTALGALHSWVLKKLTEAQKTFCLPPAVCQWNIHTACVHHQQTNRGLCTMRQWCDDCYHETGLSGWWGLCRHRQNWIIQGYHSLFRMMLAS